MSKMDRNSLKRTTISKQRPPFVYHPQETLILCVVSSLDVVMTFHLLPRGDVAFTESNPFASYFLNRWGLEGMAYFKAAMTAFVCVVTQIIAYQNPALARQVLGLATVIIVAVVIYSVWLHFNHRPTIDFIEAYLTKGLRNPVT